MKLRISTPLIKLTEYNIKIIFGNKFFYFVLSAIGFYILTVGISLFSDDEITMATGYSMLLVPSILLIFYPTCFGIQNDQDAKIIEIIFGIPNYRYKIWLFRLLIAYVICFALTLLLALLTNWLVVEVPPVDLTLQVMVPVLFIGLLCFMLSTIVRYCSPSTASSRSANGTCSSTPSTCPSTRTRRYSTTPCSTTGCSSCSPASYSCWSGCTRCRTARSSSDPLPILRFSIELYEGSV